MTNLSTTYKMINGGGTMKQIFIKIIICLIFTLILYYFMLPPINLSDPNFWVFLFIIVVFYAIIWMLFSDNVTIETIINNKKVKKNTFPYIFMAILTIVIGLIVIINVINSPVFNAKSYYERINVNNSNFNDDVAPVDFNNLPLLDKNSSIKLGDKVMGQMTDLVSQFEVSNNYTQINYNDDIVRVTPLEYASLIKYFTNRSNGVAGYITVNSVDGESNLVRLENGMKYMPSAYFFENLYRKLRISYPFTIFGEVNFEIDDEGNPYWIAETLKYTGVGLKKEVTGVVILNPIDGTSKKYKVEEVPEWVDHVYSASLIIEQLNNWGKYKNGFFNSIFGQKDVVKTTTGYNYLAMNNDVYLYTGITSVSSDGSNIGFVLVNMRTKDTKFYDVAGAEESSAMASAEGQVQQMNYVSTFPLIINLDNKPTYLLSLKDNAGLVKMYAFVDYTDYQKVVVTDASEGIIKAAENYLGNNITAGEEKTQEIVIEKINSAVLEGTTYYYLKTTDDTYRASIKVNQSILPFLKVGDKINITYKEAEINEIIAIK